MAHKQPFIDDILHALPSNRPTVWVERSLRVFARIADENQGMKKYFCEFDEDTQPGVDLLIAACIMVEPPCLTSYGVQDDKLILEFNDTYARPPINAIWTKMDELRGKTLDCYSRIEEEPYKGEYAVFDSINTPLDVISFTHAFSHEDDLPAAFYHLPEGETFTDGEGYIYSETLPHELVDEYLAAHPDPKWPNKSVNAMEPDALIISAAQMQRVLDALGIDMEKGRRAN